MGLIDPTQLLSQIIALAVVFVPIEAWILITIRPIKKRVDRITTKPEELVRVFADELWKTSPLSTPEKRIALISEFYTPIATPENRQKLVSELGHGLVRVLKENEGSLRGVAARAAKGEILEAIKGGGGSAALQMLPGKIELPVLGKVTIREAAQAFAALKEMFDGGGGGRLLTQQTSSAAGSSTLP